ncbi:unnamed protein product, partial [Iphiclides podalirius]
MSVQRRLTRDCKREFHFRSSDTAAGKTPLEPSPRRRYAAGPNKRAKNAHSQLQVVLSGGRERRPTALSLSIRSIRGVVIASRSAHRKPPEMSPP